MLNSLNLQNAPENSQGFPLSAAELLSQLIASNGARITVVGQGYVGLPLAVAFGQAGFHVTGFDTNLERVSSLNRGKSPTPDVPDEDLERLSSEGLYRASSDFLALAESDVILICVPTPLRKSKDPDISYVLSVAESIGKILRPGQLVILESTTYPGTTEELLLPLFEANGLKAGTDFFLAFSPERIDPGNTQFQVEDIPKVTGGITPHCTALAAQLYRRIVTKVLEVSNPKVAELAKLYENVFRNVNIALANEFAIMCRQLGVETREVINAAATKPFGFMAFYPGPGIGGHCIPVDPAYLAWKMRFSNYNARFISLAEEVNQGMPGYVMQLLTDALNKMQKCLQGTRVLVLGVAYKKGVGDTRESPSLHIIGDLLAKGMLVSYADPHVPAVTVDDHAMQAVELNAAALAKADCVLILTDHDDFDYQLVIDNVPLIIDTRGATWGKSTGKATIVRL
ncbi:MAG: nucleotide sugar dehydrogenase [Pseudomonadota bacterium]